MKKQAHTRSESERKGKSTSLRMSDNQFKTIQENAEKAGMTVSSYIVTVAVNGGKTLTPKDLVDMQNKINAASSVIEENNPDLVKSLQEGMNMIWQKSI